MVDNDSIHNIIVETIERMSLPVTKSKKNAMVTLVEVTFFGQSQMRTMNPSGSVLNGLPQLSKVTMSGIVNDVIRSRQVYIDDIGDTCLINLDTDHMDAIFHALAYNIAWQVACVVYFYYDVFDECDMPENVTDAVEAYINHFPKNRSSAPETIMNGYIGYRRSLR